MGRARIEHVFAVVNNVFRVAHTKFVGITHGFFTAYENDSGCFFHSFAAVFNSLSSPSLSVSVACGTFQHEFVSLLLSLSSSLKFLFFVTHMAPEDAEFASSSMLSMTSLRIEQSGSFNSRFNGSVESHANDLTIRRS